MESSEMSDEFSDWEEVTFPLDHQPLSPSSPETQHIDLDLDLILGIGKQEEDLTVQLEDSSNPENVESPPSSPLPLRGSDSDPPHQQLTGSDSRLSVIMGEVKIVICTTGRRIVKAFGYGFWCPAFVPAAALAVVILACIKIVQRWNRLYLLIKKKDQRISQLLNQISHMNEILSARRKVPVLRIN